MKLIYYIILTLLTLNTILCQYPWAGTYYVTGTYLLNGTECCLPIGPVTITQNIQNSTITIQYTASDNSICTSLGYIGPISITENVSAGLFYDVEDGLLGLFNPSNNTIIFDNQNCIWFLSSILFNNNCIIIWYILLMLVIVSLY